MSRQPIAVRTPTTTARPAPSSPPQPKLPLSGFIRRQLVTVAERDQQRAHLVNILIIAHALLTAATIPGYIGTSTALLSLSLLGAVLVVYLVALVTNAVFRRMAVAAYILVIGGGLTLAAHPVALAIVGDVTQATQASLLLSAVILITGLLFAPEVTLIVAFAATTCTAFALLYGLYADQHIGRHEAYLSVVYTLGLQLVSSLVAWLLSQFISDSVLETQRAREMQFAQARLEALTAQMDEEDRLLHEALSRLQVAISQAITHKYGVRAEVPEGPLTPLADNLNLLIERYEAALHAEQRQSRYDAATGPIIEQLVRMAETGTPTPGRLPIITNTTLDSISLVLSQMHTTLSQRIGKIQRLSGEISDLVGLSKSPVARAAHEAQEAQRIGGKVLSDAENTLKVVQSQLVAVHTIRRMLSGILPPEITNMPAPGQAHLSASGLGPEDAAILLGLGDDLGVNTPGYTGVFQALSDDGDDRPKLAPMTVPLPAIDPNEPPPASTSAEKPVEKKRSKSAKAAEVPHELMETWNLVTQLEHDLIQFERALRAIVHDLGHQTRSLRDADANIAWFRSALEDMAGHTAQLQQLAASGLPAFGAAEASHGPVSHPLRPRGQADTPPSAASPSPASAPSVPPQYTGPLPVEHDADGTLVELVRAANDGSAAPDPTTSQAPQSHIATPQEANEDQPPAPGSIRASDLISLDDIPPILGPLNQPSQE